MHAPSVEIVNEIIISEMMKWVVVGSSKRSRAQLNALSERLIRYFIMFKPHHLPTQEMVGEIILREMLGWNRKAGEIERKAELDCMAEAMIRYFMHFDPVPATLPGLPGGAALRA